MYQFIVLTLGFLLVIGGGYLIKHTDKSGVIGSTLITQSSSTGVITTVETIPGTYICDVDSRCSNPRTLIISENGELSMTTSFDNGVEILEETGTWKTETDGQVTIILTGTNSELYATPVVLTLKQVSSSTLVGDASQGGAYKEWKNSLFRKQEKQTE